MKVREKHPAGRPHMHYWFCRNMQPLCLSEWFLSSAHFSFLPWSAKVVALVRGISMLWEWLNFSHSKVEIYLVDLSLVSCWKVWLAAQSMKQYIWNRLEGQKMEFVPYDLWNALRWPRHPLHIQPAQEGHAKLYDQGGQLPPTRPCTFQSQSRSCSVKKQ